MAPNRDRSELDLAGVRIMFASRGGERRLILEQNILAIFWPVDAIDDVQIDAHSCPPKRAQNTTAGQRSDAGPRRKRW
jgi:hypothetical protein